MFVDNFVLKSLKIKRAKTKKISSHSGINPIGQVGTALILLNGYGKICGINKIFEELTGYSRAETVGMNIVELFPKMIRQCDLELAKNWIKSILTFQRKEIDPVVFPLLLKDQSRIYVCLTAVDIGQSKDNSNNAVLCMYDITNRNKICGALKESENKYESLFEELIDTIVLSTSTGKIIDINSAGVKLFGFEKKRQFLKNRSLRNLFFNLEEWHTFKKDLTKQKRVSDVDTVLKNRLDKPIMALVSANVLDTETAEGGLFQVVIRDVTKQKKLEQQLFQAQKMEAIGRLAGGIAHDFNNLLTSIIGYTEIAQMRHEQKKPIEPYLKKVLHSSGQARDFIQQLLLFSRKAMFKPEIVNINQLIKNLLVMLAHIIGQEIIFEFSPGRQVMNIQADANQMEQVILNLVMNAKEAMPKGGHLILETKNIRAERDLIEQYPFIKPGDYIVLSVIDSGYGMDEKTQSQIFEPFFTLKNKTENCGLGLSTIYGIIKQNNGYITVKSNLGQGAQFDIYLPKMETKIIQPSPGVVAAEFSRKRKTILVVEDEADVREVTQLFLSESGYHVLLAEDGEDAIHIWEKKKQEIDMILTDVVMPKMSGKELAQLLRQKDKSVKILYMSGYTREEITGNDMLHADFAFIQKPFSMDQLNKKVAEVLKSSDKHSFAVSQNRDPALSAG
jgi:PAS domain S-box-containing protein